MNTYEHDLHELTKLFADRGYEWSFSTGRRVPVEEEIDKTIIAAMKALADAEDNTEAEVGRLIIKKRGSWFDVFVHVIEIPNGD